MQRWFRSKGLNKPRPREAEPKADRVDTVHDCWQVDAKERLTMGDGQQGCNLSIVDEQRVYDFLAQKQLMRKVSTNGQITLFMHKPQIAAAHKGQTVCRKFNTFTLKWEVYANNGDFIKSIKADYLSADRIKNMTVYSMN